MLQGEVLVVATPARPCGRASRASRRMAEYPRLHAGKTTSKMRAGPRRDRTDVNGVIPLICAYFRHQHSQPLVDNPASLQKQCGEPEAGPIEKKQPS